MTTALMQTLSVPMAAWPQEKGRTNGTARPEAKTVEDAGPWEPYILKLYEFHQLGDNWDGAGAKAPSPELLLSAGALAYAFHKQGTPAPSRVVPGLDGTVLFEWQFSNGGYGEVEVVRPWFAEVMVIEPGQPAKHWTLPTESIGIVDLGRGPQLSTSRITVLDIFYYLHRGYDFDFIHGAMPSLTREEFDAVVAYANAHDNELVEKDRRADEFHQRGMEAQYAKGGIFAPSEENLCTQARVARLKEKLQQKLAEKNGAGHPH